MLKHSNNKEGRPLVAAALSRTKRAFSSVAAISAVTNILMLTGPIFMMQVYDRVLASRSVPTLVALSLLAIGLYLFLGILELIRSRILARIGEGLDEQLSDVTFEAVMVLPLRMSKKEAISQPIRDLEQIRQFMSGPGPVAICDLPWLPLYLAIIFLFHSYLGWLAVAGAAVLIALTISSEFLMRSPTAKTSRLAAVRSEVVEAGRRNAETLHAMGMRTAYSRRWNESNSKYQDEQRGLSDASATFATTSKIFRLALQSAVLALGAWLAIQQMVSPGAMIASSILTSRALAPIEQAIGQWKGFLNARQARGRLQELLERVRKEANTMPLPTPTNSLSVSSLAVVPPGTQTPIIRDITFNLSSGQGLGIIGPSGSGKSTLARALVGVWPPVRGSVRLDGAEIDQWESEALGRAIGYLPQDVELFAGTIAENISRFEDGAKPEDIITAAKLAGAQDLILSMSDGYDTQVGPAGTILSGGQRQRIGLARALYKNPFLIVLDEPNANLDAEGEAALANAIASVRKLGSIVIIVAHRPSALASVDQVLVMAKGGMVTFGPRDEVLRKTTVRPVAERA